MEVKLSRNESFPIVQHTIGGGRPSVLFVSHSGELAGAEKSLLTLARGLQASGNIQAIVLVPKKGRLADALAKANVPTLFGGGYQLWIHRSGSWQVLLGPIRFIWNALCSLLLFKKLASMDLSLVYSNSLACPLGAFLAMQHGVEHIWHAREFVHEDMNHRYDLGTTLSMWVVRKAAHVICNSNAVRAKLEKEGGGKRFSTIYNGFEFSTVGLSDIKRKANRLSASKRSIKLLMVGSVHPGKGHKDAFLALQTLMQRAEDVELVLVGSGDPAYREELDQLAQRVGIGRAVTWVGWVANPEDFYRDATILLLCSKSEAFGRVIVEAMATGTPVIGTSTGGVGEVVVESWNGLLYTPGDFAELAEKILWLVDRPREYVRLANNGTKYVREEFCVPKYISCVEKVAEHVIRSGSRKLSRTRYLRDAGS
jgi:glycosyltransferase involved in cell wall biosynthesis